MESILKLCLVGKKSGISLTRKISEIQFIAFNFVCKQNAICSRVLFSVPIFGIGSLTLRETTIVNFVLNN